MEFRILGPLQVVEDGREVPVSGPRERALLLLLALRAGHVVSADRLIDVLWDEHLPRRPANALQALVARTRKALGQQGLEPLGFHLSTLAEITAVSVCSRASRVPRAWLPTRQTDPSLVWEDLSELVGRTLTRNARS